MGLPASRLLDPEVLAEIQDLRLVAKTVVEGVLAGLHVDPRPGPGVEFSQYRAYEPGDDLRRVDWRAFARSDRYLVRESEEEREQSVRLLLDGSASMGHAVDGVSKFDYARALVACLAYLADRHGDRLRFHSVSDRAPVDLEPAGRGGPLTSLIATLESLEPAGSWPPAEQLLARLGRRRGRELVVVLSDLHQLGGELSAAVDLFASLGHEVVVVHLLGRDELDFGYRGDVVFVDLETGQEVRGRAEELREGYLSRLGEELDRWRAELDRARIAYHLISTDRPLSEALRAMLVSRRDVG